MYQKGFSNVLIIIFGILICVAAIGLYSSMNKAPARPSTSTPKPQTSPTPAPAPTPTPPVALECGIHITSPTSSTEQLTTPIVISGYVDGQCHWGAFEANAGSVVVYNDQNTALSPQVPLTVTGNWMQSPAYFNVKVGFSAPHRPRGYLLFTNDDASGMFPMTYQYPITFGM